MKNNFLNRLGENFRHGTISVSLIVIALLFLNKEAFSGGKDSTSKLSISMNVSYKASNGNKSVKVQVSRKENKKIISVDNLKAPVCLYLNEVKAHDKSDGTGLVDRMYLSKEGEAIFEIPETINKLISDSHEFTFIAKIESDPVYEDAEEEITISDAKISISYSGKDSIKTATAVLMEWKDSAYVPVPEAELKLSIKRTFSLFPIGEEGTVTDKDGKISADLPLDIPGSFEGKITIVARIDEHETFGTVESSLEVPWDVIPKPFPEMGRALWATADNAPLVLVFSSLTIIVVIWGTIFYMIYLLYRIKKLSKE